MATKGVPLTVSTGKDIKLADIKTNLFYRSTVSRRCSTSSKCLHGGYYKPLLRKVTDTQAPQSPQEKLEKFFDNRPSPAELKQRNILKDSKLAPSLQSAQVFHPL